MPSSSLTRRRCLQLLHGAALASLLPPLRADDSPAAPLPSLKDLAAAKGLKYGSASDKEFSDAPPAYIELFLAQAALYAPAISWKWTNPTPDHEDYDSPMPPMEFARQHHLPLTGAHLLWHEGLPKWFATLKPAAALDAAQRHIADMCGHFRGWDIWSWNVVNEALNPREGNVNGLRGSPLLDLLGPDFIRLAFESARPAAPGVMLVYNDFGFEDENNKAADKRAALLNLLDALKHANAPIDAVGLQSHLETGQKFDEGAYRRFLHEIAARGLKILITEFDVNDQHQAGDIPARDRAVADTAARFLNVALDEPAVTTFMTWGLGDRYSWYNLDTSGDYQREDKLPCRPLMFDENLQPKPCFDAVVKALQNAPARG